MELFFIIIFLILLLFASAILSASETALFSLSPLKVRIFGESPDSSKRFVSRLLAHPKELLVTILIMNIAVNLGVQNVVSSIFGNFSGLLLTVGVPLLLTLLFGEIIPKSLAISNNKRIAPHVAPFLVVMKTVLLPIRVVLTRVASFISRIVFFFLKAEKEISLPELKHALRASQESGKVTLDEAKLLSGSLKLEETTVKEIACPRIRILYYNMQRPLTELTALFVEEQVSKVPVVESELDNVVGIITSSQFFLHRDEINVPRDLRNYVRDAFFVPENQQARMLFALFHEKNEDLALTVDEYGQISGLLTKEDLVEIVVGQIADKRDEKMLYTRQSEDVIICSGKLEINELEEIFDLQLDNAGHVATVGGYLTEIFKDIPKSGMKHVSGDLLFHVLSSEPTRVTRIYVRKMQPRRRNV